MSEKEITCPMCKGTLVIDLSSGEVVDHKAPEHKKADLQEFLKSQKDRGSQLESMFKKASDEQKKRREKLEQEFLKAKDNPEELTGEFHSPFEWD